MNSNKIEGLFSNLLQNPMYSSTVEHLVDVLKDQNLPYIIPTNVAAVVVDPSDEWSSYILKTSDNKYHSLSIENNEYVDGQETITTTDIDTWSDEYQEIFDEWFDNLKEIVED